MIVISTKPQSVSREVTAEHRDQFLAMLPQIRKQASVACRGLRAEARQEFLQAVIAAAYVAFARLAELGKVDIAFPTPLAQFAIRHVRGGRVVGTRLNTQDVCSRYAHGVRRLRVDRLDRRYADGSWKEILVEDHRIGPAETAAARIDVSEWFRSLPTRKRRIAQALAYGEATSAVAEKHRLSAARISQLRRELAESWGLFQGEQPPAPTRHARSIPARRVTSALCAGRSTVCA